MQSTPDFTDASLTFSFFFWDSDFCYRFQITFIEDAKSRHIEHKFRCLDYVG
jgi:hypothetical protein